MKFILASASPRRKELLAELIDDFEIIPAKGEEKIIGNPTPAELVQQLARQKANEVATLDMAKGKVVLGSDTVVALDGKVLGKPKNESDAMEMLRALSGRTHEVYTGVCVLTPKGDGFTERVDVDCTKVYFYSLDEEKIRSYVASGSPMDKAGAYGIQDGGLVERIEGSFSNVVGLPLELCKKIFNEIGLK